MNFIDALKKTPGKFVEKEVILKKEEVANVLSHEQNFMLNKEDSLLINVIEDLNKLCNNFIEESLIPDEPLLMRHHTGLDDFKLKLLEIFQDNVGVEITELDEESDGESDIDSIDMLYENDYN
jgi:hypothetical protein